MDTLRRIRRDTAACLTLLLLIAPALYSQVSSAQTESEAATFHIFGLVVSPGAYEWTDALTVKDAVSLAGGYKEDGSKDELQVQRMIEGKLVSSVATEDDPLEPDDVVMVRGVPFRPSPAR
jgi:protein involved in polysaccharide export with SLBB domain